MKALTKEQNERLHEILELEMKLARARMFKIIREFIEEDLTNLNK